ncbi:MAG: anti-sigma factor antagonist [Clostridia bacterium]|nr:anti-sigma factor antagonist [Clostridia bacterium]
MEIVTSKIEGKVLFIILKGRIDSQNAADVENKITTIKGENNFEDIIIDAESLEYISSAGLRIILRLRKEYPNIKIINVSSDVYEIFDMTGFTEMIKLEKAYRKLSVDGCEIIGRGANGEVYRLDPDTIIKVYLNPDSLDDIHRERELARRAFVLGIPTAIPYDVVKVGNSYGSVFELLNAQSFSKIINADPSKIDEVVKMFVDLLKKIHSTEVLPEDMPDMKAVALDWADFLKDYLPSDKWQKLYNLIKAVPESNMMMHGDYHTKNVMLQNGEVLLIDMDTLCHGYPIFEFASIFNAYIGFNKLQEDNAPSFLGIPDELLVPFWEKTITAYFETDDKEYLDSVTDKASLIGYTRLMRRLIRRNGLEDEKGRAKIEFYKEQILTLLDRVDSLEL